MAKILETYDPEWETKWDRIKQQLDEANQAPFSDESQTRSKNLLAQLLEAFHAQFRTAGDYRDWLFEKIKKRAEEDGQPFIMPVLSDDCTVEEVRNTYNIINESLDQRERVAQFARPTYDPHKGNAFSRSIEPDETRDVFVFDYMGWHNLPAKCGVTIERRAHRAAVCFMHLPDSNGTAPMNCVEELATLFYAHRLKHKYKAEEVEFYIHVPTILSYNDEIFIHVGMIWNDMRQCFEDPEWMHQEQVPEIIREAEKINLYPASRPKQRKGSAFDKNNLR